MEGGSNVPIRQMTYCNTMRSIRNGGFTAAGCRSTRVRTAGQECKLTPANGSAGRAGIRWIWRGRRVIGRQWRRRCRSYFRIALSFSRKRAASRISDFAIAPHPAPCARVRSAYPIQNDNPAALMPSTSVSIPDRSHPASDHRLFAAPIPKNTNPVATTHSVRL